MDINVYAYTFSPHKFRILHMSGSEKDPSGNAEAKASLRSWGISD